MQHELERIIGNKTINNGRKPRLLIAHAVASSTIAPLNEYLDGTLTFLEVPRLLIFLTRFFKGANHQLSEYIYDFCLRGF